MNIIQRIHKILYALLMIISAMFIHLIETDIAITIIILVLSAGLIIDAVKDLIYYFTMARHMVGGKMILFKSVVTIDFGLLTFTVSNIPDIYALIYLVGAHAFSGVIEILRANESRKTVEGPWKLKFFHGLINIALAVACLIFLHDLRVAVLIYSAGLIYSALLTIVIAFRKTAFIVIE